MNDENIEQHLRKLPAPQLPEAWRASILSTATREAAKASRPRQVWPAILIYLRGLLARNPITGGALAALWIFIFAFKTTTPIDHSSDNLIARMDPNRPVYLISISKQIRLVELMQEEPVQRQMP